MQQVILETSRSDNRTLINGQKVLVKERSIELLSDGDEP